MPSADGAFMKECKIVKLGRWEGVQLLSGTTEMYVLEGSKSRP